MCFWNFSLPQNDITLASVNALNGNAKIIEWVKEVGTGEEGTEAAYGDVTVGWGYCFEIGLVVELLHALLHEIQRRGGHRNQSADERVKHEWRLLCFAMLAPRIKGGASVDDTRGDGASEDSRMWPGGLLGGDLIGCHRRPIIFHPFNYLQS